MKKKIRVLGVRLPLWLLVLALAAAGLGVATASVMTGEIEGGVGVPLKRLVTLDTDLSPPVQGAPTGLNVNYDSRGTSFWAETSEDLYPPVEETITVRLEYHKATGSAICELTLEHFPICCTPSVNITEGMGTNDISNLIRVGPYTWQFQIGPDSDFSNNDSLDIILHFSDSVSPGTYAIGVIINVLEVMP
jgi:hypothetical protein